MLIENLSINVTPGGIPVTIHISQYDIGLRTFVFSPYTSHGTFTPDSAAAATLEGTKPDGNVIIHNCQYNSTNGQITYTVKEQLAAVAGKVWSKLTLRDTSGNAIGYAAIIWMVDMAGVEDGAIASDSDISALQEFIAEFGTINAYKAALDGALAAVGGPYVASTVSQMTDHSKVYVYTGSQTGYTAGHWYYWNGSAWTDGGVYQAAAVETDKTLTVADMAADAKATGDAVTELKNDLGQLYSAVDIDVVQSTQYFELDFIVGHSYVLTNNTDNSMNAHTMSAPSASGTAVEAIGTNIQAGMSVTFAPTVAASYGRVYCNGRGSVTIKDISTAISKLEDDVAQLQTSAQAYVQKDGVAEVNERNTTFFTQSANLFNKGTVLDNYDLKQDGSGFYAATGYMATEEYIDVSNLNSIKALAIVNGAVAAASIRYVLYNANKTALNQRTITNAVLDTSNASYLRFGASLGQKDVLMIVPGGTEVAEYIPYGFTFNYAEENGASLVKITPTDDVIQKLLDNKGKDIYFDAGDYDIIAQYEAHFGSDYFTNYTDYTSGGDNLGRGLPVYRGTKVTFSQGAVFSANYTGGNTAVRTNFSAFWLESGVTVDGLRMVANGIRNIIHDDFDNTYNGMTVIKNCHLTGDTNIIAGGLGLHETVIIENCYIERTNSSATYDLSYHNNGNAGAQSLLIVKDNYLKRGLSVRWYGQSTLLTDVMVSNNSMAYEIDIHAENASATIENINLMAWNNEIRSA